MVLGALWGGKLGWRVGIRLLLHHSLPLRHLNSKRWVFIDRSYCFFFVNPASTKSEQIPGSGWSNKEPESDETGTQVAARVGRTGQEPPAPLYRPASATLQAIQNRRRKTDGPATAATIKGVRLPPEKSKRATRRPQPCALQKQAEPRAPRPQQGGLWGTWGSQETASQLERPGGLPTG